MQIDDILRPLEPYLWDQPPNLPGFTGFAAVQGKRGPVGFIVTIDHDGQVELSLSTPKGLPTEAHGRAFLKAWGQTSIEATKGKRIRHYVVRLGKTQ